MTTTKGVVKDLKPGKYCVIDDEPCKVQSVTISAPGKHGHAKARLDAVGVFDGKKRSIVKCASLEIDVPIIEKKTGQIVMLSGNTAQIMDLQTYETFDAIIPDEMKDKVVQGGEVSYWILMGRRLIVSGK